MKTMQEIEAKFYVSNLRRIRARLRKLRAKLIHRRTLEANLRFDTVEGSFRRAGKVLRLRMDDKARMTYKGAGTRESGVTSRTEIEFVVEDFELARLFLESLGYRKLVYYEKYRTTYKLGKTLIMLDELPFGSFVEIEGPEKGLIRIVANRLQINWKAAIEASYHSLFERVRKKRKLGIRDLSFRAFRKIKIDAADLSVTPAD